MIGAGQQAATHLLPSLQQLPTATIVGIADLEQSRCDLVADRFGIPARAETINDLLACAEADLIVAACPPSAHDEITGLAIERRIPIFVEKPPATCTSRLAETAFAAEDNKVATGVGMNFRWAEPIGQLAALLAEPDIGQPIMVAITHLANKPQNGLWGLDPLKSYLLAQAIHPIDLLMWLAGPLADIDAACYLTNGAIHVGLQGRAAGGGICSLVTGLHNGPFLSRVEVVTDHGVTITLTNLANLTVQGLDPCRYRWYQQWQPSPLNTGYTRTGYQHQLAAFVDAVADGTTFRPGLADLVPTYEVIDQITNESLR